MAPKPLGLVVCGHHHASAETPREVLRQVGRATAATSTYSENKRSSATRSIHSARSLADSPACAPHVPSSRPSTRGSKTTRTSAELNQEFFFGARVQQITRPITSALGSPESSSVHNGAAPKASAEPVRAGSRRSGRHRPEEAKPATMDTTSSRGSCSGTACPRDSERQEDKLSHDVAQSVRQETSRRGARRARNLAGASDAAPSSCKESARDHQLDSKRCSGLKYSAEPSAKSACAPAELVVIYIWTLSGEELAMISDCDRNSSASDLMHRLIEVSPLQERQRYRLICGDITLERNMTLSELCVDGNNRLDMCATVFETKERPAVEMALALIAKTRPQEYEKMREDSNPPTCVRVTCEAVCHVLGIQPEIDLAVSSDDSVSEYFSCAKASFLQPDGSAGIALQDVDLDGCHKDSVLAKLVPCFEHESLTPEYILRASNLCYKLFMWVCAVVYDLADGDLALFCRSATRIEEIVLPLIQRYYGTVTNRITLGDAGRLQRHNASHAS